MHQLGSGVILVGIVEVQSPGVILDLVGVAGGALADQAIRGALLDVVGIEGDVSSQAHGQALGQLLLLVDVGQEGRHVAGLPLGGGVQGNAHQLMVDERVVEAVLHGGSELFQILLVQRQGGDDLLVQHLVHEAADGIVVHAVTHDVKTGQVCAQNETGVGTVQDADLALLVGGDIGHDHDVDAGLLERQLVLQTCGALDDPHAEHFTHVQYGVVVAVDFLHGSQLLRVTDAARNDTVHQGGAEGVGVVHPVDEGSVQVPVLGVVVAALLQLLAVVVDQLAAQDDQALVGSAVESLVALVQHAGELCGEAVGGHLVELAVALGVRNASLGGVGYNRFQILRAGQSQHFVPLAINVGAHAVGHAGDHALGIDLLALLAAAQVQGVQALLLVDPVRHLGEVADGLHQLDLAVVASLLIGDIIEIIHESTQEVAFAELHDLDGGILEDVAVVASLSQNLVVQSFHLCVLLFASSLSISCRGPHAPVSYPYFMLLYTNKSSGLCIFFRAKRAVLRISSGFHNSSG